MANPVFHEYMTPILRYLSNKGIYHKRIIAGVMSDIFKLGEKEKAEKLEISGEAIYLNRVGWALTYLKKAGLVNSPKRGFYKITENGRIHGEICDKIDIKYLKQFKGFKDFYSLKKEVDDFSIVNSQIKDETMTPNELLEDGYARLKREICHEMLNKIMSLSPNFFEKLIIHLLIAMGYGGGNAESGYVSGKPGDRGIDGLIKEDKLGLDMIYLQAKRYNEAHKVQREEIQKFIGALTEHGARKGVFITTSSFTSGANNYKLQNGMSLVKINGEELVNLMYRYNVGVITRKTYEIKSLDEEYFEE